MDGNAVLVALGGGKKVCTGGRLSLQKEGGGGGVGKGAQRSETLRKDILVI